MTWTKQATSSGSGTNTPTIQDFYKQSKSGMVIDFVGDSTTDVATAMFTRFTTIYQATGGWLAGATINNRGNNGGTLTDHVNNVAGKNNLSTVLADKANLYVYDYGINDIRAGSGSPARTPSQIRADLKTAIDAILNQTNGYILLRIPNPFITTNTMGWIDDITKAEEYSNQLWQIYWSFKDYSPRLDIIDIPRTVFGVKCRPFHPLMLNTLHPNDQGYIFNADVIAERICDKEVPELYTNSGYEVVMHGSISSIDNTQVTFWSGNLDENVQVGDLLILNNSYGFTIENTPIKGGGFWQVVQNHTGDYSGYGAIKILRRKQRLISSNDRSWVNANIASNSGYAGIWAIVNISSYNFSGSYTIGAGATVYAPSGTVYSNYRVEVGFDTQNTTWPTNGLTLNDGITYTESPFIGQTEIDYFLPTGNTLTLGSQTYAFVRVAGHKQGGLTTQLQYYVTNGWIQVGSTLISIPNSAWQNDSVMNGGVSGSVVSLTPGARDYMTYDGVIALLKSKGLIS